MNVSTAFLTEKVENGPPIGQIIARPKEIEIDLLDPLMREKVCALLGICKVRALSIKGGPQSPTRYLQPLGLEQLETFFSLATRNPEIAPHLVPKTMEVPLGEALAYAKARISFERDWIQKNAEEYRRVRITGSGHYGAYKPTAKMYWASLLKTFSEADGRSVTLRELADLYWTAIGNVMTRDEFHQLNMSLR